MAGRDVEEVTLDATELAPRLTISRNIAL